MCNNGALASDRTKMFYVIGCQSLLLHNTHAGYQVRIQDSLMSQQQEDDLT